MTQEPNKDELRLKHILETRPDVSRRSIINNIKGSYKKQFEETVKDYQTQLINKGNKFDYNSKMDELIKSFQNKLDKLKNEEGKFY